jgi:hypothetical protein
MKGFELEIFGHRETFKVTAYEPYPGAPFVAHRSLGRADWVVAHKGSTYIVARPVNNTRKQALQVAQKLSENCPSAPEVTMGMDANGRPTAGDLVGPLSQMQAEILAVLPNPREAA